MNTRVEAQSLSSLTTLFANPPQYPRNPTHEVQPPLVLYIVRVPGSRDVFLTTVKPPTKASIGPEAIQSCLYYLHVTTPEDEAVTKSFEEERMIYEAKNVLQSSRINRKPLPVAPFTNYPASGRPPVPPKSYPHFQPAPEHAEHDTQAARYAARGSHLRLDKISLAEPMSTRNKPRGPRSFCSAPRSENIPPIVRKPVEQPSELDDVVENDEIDLLRNPPISNRNTPAENGSQISTGTCGIRTSDVLSGTSDELDRLSAYDMDEITLIRRDLSSDSQWNIGTMRIEDLYRVDRRSSPDIAIRLTAPGYQKFRTQSDRSQPVDVTDLQSARASLRPSTPNESPLADLSTTDATDKGFTRKFDVNTFSPFRNPSARHYDGITSEDLLASLKHNIASISKSSSRRVCSFTSPWQGICHLTGRVDGRSLCCTHTLPTANPDAGKVVANVAELRLNFPWLGLKPKNQGGNDRRRPQLADQGGLEKRELFRRSVQRLKDRSLNRPSSEMSNYNTYGSATSLDAVNEPVQSDSDSLMDLKLGRERAGGGFKGKSAKLGKLIIEDEGLKMCDLVVAACMGVWWQQYSTKIGDTF